MPRLSKGVPYAEDAQDAENSVFESDERYDILDDNERGCVLSVAQNIARRRLIRPFVRHRRPEL